MLHPIEQNSATVLAGLRDATFDVSVENDVRLGPGIYFSWDAKNADISIDVESAPGSLFTATTTLTGDPEWFCLNLDLGKTGLAPGDILGAVIDIRGGEGADIPLFVRSGYVDGGHTDTWFEEPLIRGDGNAVRTIMHLAKAEEALSWENTHHTLVMNLPKTGGTLTLHDLCLFVVPATRDTPDA